MKIRFLLSGLFFALIFIVTTSVFNSAKSNESGAPAGKTGSPRDGSSCTSCHTPATNFSGAGAITSNIPTGGYTAGQTYTITASIVRSGHVRFGFEASPQDTTSAHNYIGTMTVTNASTTQIVGTNYITHTSNGTSGTNSDSWSFNWKAPATGKGPAVFYGAFNASNNNGQDTGDSIFLASYKVYECFSPAQPGSITGTTSVCANSSFTYSVAAVSGATSYNWTLPNGWTGTSSTNSITATSGTQGGTISVSATNGCGTSTASTQTVTITSAGAASVSIAATKDTICSGTQVSFTASPTNGGTTPAYQWKLNGTNVGADSSGYTNPNLANGDRVSCILTSDLACVTQSPATSNTIAMLVDPVLTASVSITASQDTICSGTPVNFTAKPVNGGSAPEYQWQRNGGNIAGQTSGTFSSAVLADSDRIGVVMTSSASCVAQAEVLSNIVEIRVNPVVVPSVTIMPNSGNSICANQAVQFSGNFINGGTAPALQWYDNGSPVVGQTAATYQSSSLSDGDSITLSLISNATCASPDTVNSNGVVMHIVNNATPSVSINTNVTDSICQGQNVVFTAQPVNGGTSPEYQWLMNREPISGDTLNSFSTAGLANGDSISVNMTSNSTCVVSQFASSGPVSLTVIASVTPTISIVPDSGFSICPGQQVVFTTSVGNQGALPEYQWKNNGVDITGANSSSYTTSSLSNGDIISCLLISSAQCASPSSVTSAADTIQTYSVTKPLITQSNDTLVVSQENTYQWFLNDTAITGAVQQTLLPKASGNYYILVTDVNGCSGLSDTVSVHLTGINEVTAAGNISIYPNPTDGMLNIEIGQAPNIATIKLYDINGRLIFENRLTNTSTGPLSLDVRMLDNGVYLLSIVNDKNTYTTRFVKE